MYSLSRMRPRPCRPGGYGRRSIGHFIVSHLGPLRKSFMRSRRQSRQTGPVYLAIRPSRPAAPLGPRGAGVGHRIHHAQTLRRLGGRHPLCGIGVTSLMPSTSMPVFWIDRMAGLPAGARALHHDVDPAHAVLHRPARRGLGCELRRERRALAGALEADVAGRGPRRLLPCWSEIVMIVLLNEDLMCAIPCVMFLRSRRRGAALRPVVLPSLRLHSLLGGIPTSRPLVRVLRSAFGCAPQLSMVSIGYLRAFFLPATVFFGPLRVRALVRVR